MSQQHVVVEHLVSAGKVVGGGAATATATYQAVAHMDIAQATAYASLTAACMTAIYFGISAGYALWKWKKDASGKL